MYDFLAGLCVRPSAESLGAVLKHPLSLPKNTKVLDGPRRALDALQSSRPDFSKEDAELRLQVEWTRLFRGVAKGYSPPPPYESVYRDGLLGGPTVVSVTQLYARNGVGLSSKSTEMPDYIGVEFKFMSTLASKEAEAWSADTSKALELIDVQRQFARDHLRPWVPRFCAEATKVAKTDFYRAVIKVIRSISEWDAALLEGIEGSASNAT